MENKYLNKVSSLLLYISILLFIIAFNFAHNPPGGWYQQLLPEVNGATLQEITFLDSSVGFVITRSPANIIKTTNGGDNWIINFTYSQPFYQLQFLNKDTGYVLTFDEILKTTDCGNNWFHINMPQAGNEDIYALNNDTIWAASSNGLVGGAFLTTNGGVSWAQKFSGGNANPSRVYFLNSKFGFISDDNGPLYRTTNGGENWTGPITGVGGFTDMEFVDDTLGWKADGNMMITTNGGINWTNQILPGGSGFLTPSMLEFSNVSKDTIWGVGGRKITGLVIRGIIYKTTNGGINWNYQLPDTSINMPRYFYSSFVNSLNGWSYFIDKGVHTTTGGDTITYTGIRDNGKTHLKEFSLAQNYPNPFNPNTSIGYELQVSGSVVLEVYDINGKKIKTLVNTKQPSGEYEVIFNATGLSSGIYFYSLFIEGVKADTKRMIFLK